MFYLYILMEKEITAKVKSPNPGTTEVSPAQARPSTPSSALSTGECVHWALTHRGGGGPVGVSPALEITVQAG
jgi:hypothetical protein